MKVTTITDTESLAVLDLQCSAEWSHDTKLGPQVVRRNADDLLSVAADKGFHDWASKFEFYTLGVDPLVLERGSSPATVGHNALIREKGVLSAMDVRNVVFDDEALARLCRASAVLVS